mmetsp:Transcript_109581/g.353689  ORF Transcript_109581/g.353689 Transcript_109581/m.353689 type:complete len:231 (+) Transcript_109581:1618-2310(+)
MPRGAPDAVPGRQGGDVAPERPGAALRVPPRREGAAVVVGGGAAAWCCTSARPDRRRPRRARQPLCRAWHQQPREQRGPHVARLPRAPRLRGAGAGRWPRTGGAAAGGKWSAVAHDAGEPRRLSEAALGGLGCTCRGLLAVGLCGRLPRLGEVRSQAPRQPRPRGRTRRRRPCPDTGEAVAGLRCCAGRPQQYALAVARWGIASGHGCGKTRGCTAQHRRGRALRRAGFR